MFKFKFILYFFTGTILLGTTIVQAIKCGKNEEINNAGYDCADCSNYNHVRCPLLNETRCYCKTGYVRNYDGVCVSLEMCDEQNTVCSTNEMLQDSGYDCRTCDRPNARCHMSSQKKCYCKKGYVRDSYGNCVSVNSCPKKPTCSGSHEYYSDCGSACPDTCQRRNRHCSEHCEAGCFCKNGYLRDELTGHCIPEHHCEDESNQRCGKNEEYSDCGSACPDSCQRRNRHCIQRCESGCFCKKGYIRDDATGNCVREEECQTHGQCKANEVYKSCGSACPDTCQSRDKKCSYGCVSGCFCKDGYIRNEKNGLCVPESHCPEKKCGKNEVAACEQLCQPTCKYPFRLPCPSTDCGSGCVCKRGYIRRDSDHKCIPISRCPNANCKANEVYKLSGRDCKTCDNSYDVDCPILREAKCYCKSGYVRDNSGNCVSPDQCQRDTCPEHQEHRECGDICLCGKNGPVCSRSCTPGCFCKRGYVVDSNSGRCVHESECGSGEETCPEHETYSDCGSSCERSCQNPNPEYCTEECVKGCFCKDGYVRDESSGRCVRMDQCQNNRCPENAVYKSCGTPCPDSCQNRGRICAQICSPGCFCKEGYIRDEVSDRCIPESQCPKQCGQNEESSCEQPCQPTCSDPYRKPCPTLVCGSGCQCKQGYIRRDGDGMCIPISQCPNNHKCERNEVYRLSGSECESCENYRKNNCPTVYEPRCYCKDGYVRNNRGKCVSAAQCEEEDVCDANEEYDECGSICEPNCDEPHKNCESGCIRGCYCKRGYLRDTCTGKCIPRNSCVQKQCKKPNEVFRKCGASCEPSCNDRYKRFCNSECRDGCACKDGYVRDNYGNCVYPDQCPNECPANEVYKKCGASCEPTCNDRYKRFCNSECRDGCACKDGYVRDNHGNCVYPSHCPKECPSNEVFKKCGASCQPTCENQHPDCGYDCRDGCACKDGYVRNSMGQCVHKDQCSQVSECKGNEEYKECGKCEGTCQYPSHGYCSESCQKGCFCKKGYVRDESGECIAEDECPPECGSNEVFRKCGASCQATCDNRHPKDCYEECLDGCACKKGYVRDNHGKCIQADKCPDTGSKCRDNEEYRECGPTCEATCDEPHLYGCNERCVKGCFCRQGYVRDSFGNCIPQTYCPVKCNQNEVFKKCGASCQATCDNRYPANCNYDCKDGCACVDGYVRDKSGYCIPSSQCPSKEKKCGQNEVFKEIGSDCRTCNNLHPINCDVRKEPRCYCKEGYVRDSNGFCIHADDCQNNERFCELEDPNSEYTDCVGCEVYCPLILNSPLTCKEPCRKGCRCKDGYMRHKLTGRCISKLHCLLHLPK